MRYSIDVSMTPAEHDNPKKPYFWFIRVHVNRACCNGGHGWAATPEEAWKEAYTFYTRYIQENCS